MNSRDVIRLLLDECREAGAQSTWAKKHGLSASYVTDVVRGRRAPGPRLLKALGLETVTDYRKTKKP